MEIRKEINDFYALADMVWSGAVDTIADIQNANKEDEFMNFLEMVFCDEIPTDTEVNDFIWHDRDYIYENIGLAKDGKLYDDEMIEALNESIKKLELEDNFEKFCGDCEECICDGIGSTIGDCKALFEDFKNQVITIDDIKETWEEETGMNVW